MFSLQVYCDKLEEEGKNVIRFRKKLRHRSARWFVTKIPNIRKTGGHRDNDDGYGYGDGNRNGGGNKIRDEDGHEDGYGDGEGFGCGDGAYHGDGDGCGSTYAESFCEGDGGTDKDNVRYSNNSKRSG